MCLALWSCFNRHVPLLVFFNPFDDRVFERVHAGVYFAKQVSATQALPHNNQTGRWLTKFQLSWDPKSRGLFAIGSMQRNPHGVSFFA